MSDEKPKARVVAVFRKGKGHESYPDGWIIHPDDRAVREVDIEKDTKRKRKK